MMMTTTETAPKSKGMYWAGWIVSAVPVVMLLLSAVMKLIKAPPVVGGFAHFGYPEYQIRVFGVIELTCTILYLIPRTSILGAVLLTGYFGGAIATHVRVGEIQFLGATLFGVMIWLGLFLRDRRIRELLPLRN